MPVPYLLTINVDIWTSNTDQKLQLIEQIGVLFNPTINLYTNDNPLDWSRLTHLEMTNISWTSRSVPVGVDDPIDVATLTFQMPIFINPPARVERMNIINNIIGRIHTVDTNTNLDEWSPEDTEVPEWNVVTLENYWLKVENNKAFLVKSHTQNSTLDSLAFLNGVSEENLNIENRDRLKKDFGLELFDDENQLLTNASEIIEDEKKRRLLSWQEYFFDLYGDHRPGISKIELIADSEMENAAPISTGNLYSFSEEGYLLTLEGTVPNSKYRQGYWRLLI